MTAQDAEYAAAKLAKILASREAKRVAVAGKGAAQVVKPVAKSAAAPMVTAPPPVAKVLPLKERPVLRLPAFRQKCG